MEPTVSTVPGDRFAAWTFRWIPLACLAVPAGVAAVIGPGWTERIAPLPWMLSLVFCGLPHGAADYAISRARWSGWPLAGLWLTYGLSMIAVAAVFAWAPVFALATFACLSAWHFGVAHAAAGPPAAGGRAVAAAARGCMVLAAPLWFWSAATASAASELVTLVVPDGPHVTADQARAAGGILGSLGLLAIVVEVIASCRAGAPAGLPLLLGEVGVILALGAVTHPLFSVGLYFLVWHGWRQMEPLARAVTGSSPRSWPQLLGAVGRVHAAALPLLVPAWAALGLAWWAWSPDHTLHDLAILSVGGYLVVTPAHELLGDLGPAGPFRWPGAGPGGRWSGGRVAAGWGLSRGRFW